MALSTLVAVLLSQSGLQPVSRLEKILAGQGFNLAVMDGGAAVLTANATGERESLMILIKSTILDIQSTVEEKLERRY